MSDKLTLNLGVRWDVDVPRSAAHNYTSNFSPTANDPEYSIPGALVFGTQYKGNTRWANTYYKDIATASGLRVLLRMPMDRPYSRRGGHHLWSTDSMPTTAME